MEREAQTVPVGIYEAENQIMLAATCNHNTACNAIQTATVHVCAVVSTV